MEILVNFNSYQVRKRSIRMKYLLIFSPGEKWVESKNIQEQPFYSDHMMYMLSLKGILLGGPFDDNQGGACLIEVNNDDEISIVINNEPLRRNNVAKIVTYPWMTVINRMNINTFQLSN